MSFRFWRRMSGAGDAPIDGVRDVAATVARRPSGDEAADDIFPKSSNIDRLDSRNRIEVLQDALERFVKAQARFEDSFYRIAVRAREAEMALEHMAASSPTKLNVNIRRLETESRRLEDLLPDMSETIERIELIRLHLKAVRIGGDDPALRQARDDCNHAIGEFLDRARKCLVGAGDLDACIQADLATLSVAGAG